MWKFLMENQQSKISLGASGFHQDLAHDPLSLTSTADARALKILVEDFGRVFNASKEQHSKNR